MSFNFDEWADLYKTDRDEFERRRTEVINQAIASAPADKQLMLHQLQWRLDGIHRTHTPIAGLLKMQGMMMDSFMKLNDQLQVLVNNPALSLVK